MNKANSCPKKKGTFCVLLEIPPLFLASIWVFYARLGHEITEFRDLCVSRNIVPLVLFIPTSVHTYAPYATDESGSWWLENREIQMASRSNVERTIIELCKKLELSLIDLTPAFEAAIAKGKILHYLFDEHWNSEGRQVAATVVAEHLKILKSG